MRGFAVIFLMVMAMLMIAPMTVMSHGGMGHNPVLALSMDNSAFVVLGKAIMGQEQPRPHEGKITVYDSYMMITAQATMSARVVGDNEITYMRPRATADKAGGAAIFASGKQMPSPFKLITI